MSDDKLFVYDKAKYHWETVNENELPEEHTYHHTTFFLSWLIRHHLLSESFEDEVKEDLEKYRDGTVSVNELYEYWDCVLSSDMLSDEGNLFARKYFEFEKGKYLDDYQKTLVKKLPTEFHVKYTQENEAAIHGVITDRYAKWKKKTQK